MKARFALLKNIVVLFVVAAALAILFQVIGAEKAQNEIDPTEKLTKTNLLSRINAERSKNGVAPLKISVKVAQSAQLKADDMLHRDYREHEMPDTGNVLNEEMKSLLTASCSDSSENLVYGYKDKQISLDQAIHSWMDSPAHRAAILNPNYTTTGFGVAGEVVVQHFCIAY